MRFFIGDRIRCLKSFDNDSTVGKTGTVVFQNEKILGVMFDENIDGHTARGFCKNGFGWEYYVDEAGLYLGLYRDEHFNVDKEALEEFINSLTRSE